jgi:hypothetical protein
MNLKQAREQGKMKQFIKEHEAKFPFADKKRNVFVASFYLFDMNNKQKTPYEYQRE